MIEAKGKDSYHILTSLHNQGKLLRTDDFFSLPVIIAVIFDNHFSMASLSKIAEINREGHYDVSLIPQLSAN